MSLTDSCEGVHDKRSIYSTQLSVHPKHFFSAIGCSIDNWGKNSIRTHTHTYTRSMRYALHISGKAKDTCGHSHMTYNMKSHQSKRKPKRWRLLTVGYVCSQALRFSVPGVLRIPTMQGPGDDLTDKGCMLKSLMGWVWYLTPTGRKERIDFQNFSWDFPTLWYVFLQLNKYNTTH